MAPQKRCRVRSGCRIEPDKERSLTPVQEPHQIALPDRRLRPIRHRDQLQVLSLILQIDAAVDHAVGKPSAHSNGEPQRIAEQILGLLQIVNRDPDVVQPMAAPENIRGLQHRQQGGEHRGFIMKDHSKEL